MIELLIILLLLLLNGLFAMYEIALVSARKARLETAAQKGNRNARRVLRQKEHPEQILSTIQVGITLVGIVSGAFGGVTLAQEVTPFFAQWSPIAPYADDIAMILVVGAITYLSLVIGELVPKSVALNHPEGIAMSLSPLMHFVTKVAYPFVYLLSLSTRAVNRLLGVKTGEEQPLTEEELKFMLHESSEQGVITPQEGDMLKEVFRFTDKQANELMTHRSEVAFLKSDMSREAVFQLLEQANFSRYPLCNDSLEQVIGVISVKRLATLLHQSAPFQLSDIATEPLYIPEQLVAPRILELFKSHQTNFGFVVDEYGTVEGILTLHDLAEHIFGELLEEGEVSETAVIERADGSLLVDGRTNIDDFFESLGVGAPDDLDEGFTTLNGLAMHCLRSIPKEGDIFHIHHIRFEVVDMDGNRVDKLLVSRNAESIDF